MKIKWFGHSCFLLTSDDGVKVLTDPFNKSVGYKLPEVEADIVTTSHDHSDHNNIKIVKNSFIHINQAGKFSKEGIEVKGIATFHDKSGGSKGGKNIIFNFNIDGINVCHCGDLGHVLTDEQLKEIGSVDVLIIPVGGFFTINGLMAVEVMKQLKPTIVIPMHYRTKALGILRLFLGKADKFVTASGEKVQEFGELVLDKSDLTDYSGIVILRYE